MSDEPRNEAPLGEVLERIHDRLTSMESLIEADGTKQQAFDSLYVELGQYKQDFLARALDPVLRDLCLLYDNVVVEESASPAVGRIRTELVEVLYRQGLSLLEEDSTGCEPERAKHKSIGTEPTDQADRHGKIARLVKHGFERNGKVFRPQQVVTWKYVLES